MKRLLTFVALAVVSTLLSAQTPKNVKYRFTEASKLNLIGKIMEDTPNPYHRVDTTMYTGFTKGENNQVRSSAGLAVLFRTNSSVITVKTEFGYMNMGVNTMGVSLRGYDLYIKKNGEWLYAMSKANAVGKEDENLVLIKDMDNSMKECMLYLPIYSEEHSIQIGVQEGASIEALESPFRHRIGIYGSSYTQGISTTRAGMSYPMQLMRMTGLQFLNLGCSGNCKMQPYFADVLCDAEVDAFIFDCFSNPDARLIEERLFPFIEKIQAAHPGKPLIFQQTIYREGRNFSQSIDEKEKAKQKMAAQLMRIACRKYDDVYFIQTDATDSMHSTSVDGIHPSDYGYTLWARSVKKPLMKILGKYGIR